jgi:hypothetical protein
MEHETTAQPIAHASITREIEKNISLLAKAEKRSKSAMIRILIEEALDARAQNDHNST